MITYEDLQAEVWDLRRRLDAAQSTADRDVVSSQAFLEVQAEAQRLRSMLAEYGREEFLAFVAGFDAAVDYYGEVGVGGPTAEQLADHEAARSEAFRQWHTENDESRP